MLEFREEERIRQQGRDRQAEQIEELSQRLRAAEEQKGDNEGAAAYMQRWIDEGRAQVIDGELRLVDRPQEMA